MLYYLYDEDTNELLGIDKAICSSIEMIIVENQIDEIIFTQILKERFIQKKNYRLMKKY